MFKCDSKNDEINYPKTAVVDNLANMMMNSSDQIYERKDNQISLSTNKPFLGSYLLSGFKKANGLKDFYKNYFPIGVAVTPNDTRGAEKSLILEHFNSITAENAMKMGPLQPGENRYFWTNADSIVEFGVKKQIKSKGTLLSMACPNTKMAFRDTAGKTISKELLLARIKNHINTVVPRYKAKIYAWDVVNEVIADDTSYFRKSPLYNIAGEDFVEQAFRYAHAADPKAILFYNDYNTEIPAKREKIYKMLKGLLAKGVPIHGVGLQAHWSINNPSKAELEKSIEMFSSLGLQIQFTELDISVYTGRQGGQLIAGEKAKEQAVFTPEMEQKQLEKYKMIFEVFRKYKKHITGVTFWNLSDKYTWLDGRGRKNFPLLFDTELKPKKAYYEVIKF